MTDAVKVKITPGVAYEYSVRDVFPDGWDEGFVVIPRSLADDMLSDAVHYADPASTDMEASARRIYAAHAKRLRVALATA